ncbi:HNH endonuclease [Chryseobacterium sp. SIMBA_038]|uniref:HNH endonuclease n=2 Tax=Pseudomonadati TaxID=3379134 RepID=UPI00397BCE1A
MAENLWVLKSVLEKDKSSQTIESYEDSITEYYNYDNFVQNSRQIKGNDTVIIIDKEKILGFAQIGEIHSKKGIKTFRRCPICLSTNITIRNKKTPVYRCNKKHEFDSTIDEIRDVTKYKAMLINFISISHESQNLKQLRPYYIQGYNQNLSMQRLDYKTLDLFDNIKENLRSDNSRTFLDENENIQDMYNYFPDSNDEREDVLREIKARRGQEEFRKKLLDLYQNKCAITDCKVIEILEAAHISPYRGVKDNHQSNGLLLRADIHTLFDLNLIAINPKSFEVELSSNLLTSEYFIFNNKKLTKETISLISVEALHQKWKQFKSGYVLEIYK